ncbi:hypothetical protein TYRP_005758 [Tyrophagus putrescentiae]|nr:hypothetical protein TYRP_005758 [Tyrophagus putrescentiae]
MTKWIVVGPARVGIYHDTEANSFRIVARRIGEESHEVVANCPVGETFSYNESTPSFHQWRDQVVVGPAVSVSGPSPGPSSRVLGVKFGSTEEGALFADTIRRILATFESVHRMMLESGAAAALEDGGHHPHLYHPQNYHHNHQYSQQQLPPQNPPPPVPGSSSSGGGSQSSSSSLYGGSGDQPPHFAAAAVLQRGKPVPPPPPPPSLNGGCQKNGGGAPVNGSGSGSNSGKPAIQPKPGFLSEMEITLARRRAKIEAADGGAGGGSEVEISLNGRDHHQPVLPILSRKNSTSEQLSTFAPLNKPVNGLHPSNSFSNPSSPSIEQQQPIGVNGSPQMMSPLAIEKLKQEILGEIRQEFAAFKMDLLQVIKEQMSSH